MLNISSELQSKPYHGRGIIIGKTPNKKHAVVAYFIMGRSENSRNRVFSNEKGNDNLITKAFDESKMTDPSLVIYSFLRTYEDMTIVTNGDQTDNVHDFLSHGKGFEDALRKRTFEPDPPILTPRISGIVNRQNGDFSYKMSILKSANGDESSARRYFFEYETPQSGVGHFIHTYQGEGEVPLSFHGEPKEIETYDNIQEFTDSLWENLNSDNKISLYVRYIDLATGEFDDRIVNKY